MTPEDIQFIKEQASKLFPDCTCDICRDLSRLLTLLVSAEARGDKAEFFLRHPRSYTNKDYCLGCNSQQKSHWEDEHFWTDSAWIKAVRERWEI